MNKDVSKQELMEWLAHVDDPATLENVQLLKEHSERSLKWDDLPQMVKEGIKKGRKDIKAGRFTPNKEFWEKYEHRL